LEYSNELQEKQQEVGTVFKIKKKYIIIFSFFTIILFIGTTSNILQQNNSNFENKNLKTSSDTGWINPQTAENIDRDGENAWYQPNRIKIQDDSKSYPFTNAGHYTNWIRATNFDFSIPEENQIDGIEVRFDKFASYDNDHIIDSSIRLLISTGVKGSDKATGTYWNKGDTDTYILYGGSSDKWDTTWTLANINSIEFGIQLSAYTNSQEYPCVDHIQMKIYYSEIGGEETDPPTWDTLTESNDPLLLTNTETININVYDESDITNVYLEIDSINWSMSYISGDTWRNSTWTPLTIGIKFYQIHMIDEHGNTNQTTILNITVYEEEEEEENPPTWDTLTESDDPLFLTNTETININVYDESTITNVYLEINSVNWSMSFVSGDTWRNSTWTPLTIGIKFYQIHMIDEHGNTNQTTILNITVTTSDTNPPSWIGLIEWSDPQSIGINITIQINVTDSSGILFVYIQIDNINYSMRNESGTYFYSNWVPETFGIHDYKIIMRDTLNNTGYLQGQISIVNILDPFVIIFIFIFIFGLNFYVYMKVKGKGGILLMMFITFLNIYLVVESLSANLVLAPYIQLFFVIGNILLLVNKFFKL